MIRAETTQGRLKELLHYDPESGVWTRIKKRGGQIGVIRLTPRADGYSFIRVDNIQYLSHRLAWLYVHGEWPKKQLDHINGDRTDGRLANLRDVTPTVNQQNQKKARRDNVTGYLGVAPHGKKFQSAISIPGRRVRHLGTFETAIQAHNAYLEAKRASHEGCTI